MAISRVVAKCLRDDARGASRRVCADGRSRPEDLPPRTLPARLRGKAATSFITRTAKDFVRAAQFVGVHKVASFMFVFGFVDARL